MMDKKKSQRITELLMFLCDGKATQEHVAELEGLVDQDREALEYCVDTLMDLSCIHGNAQIPLNQSQDKSCRDESILSLLSEQERFDVLESLVEMEKTAPTVEIEKSVEVAPPPIKIAEQKKTKINRFWLYTSIVSSAAMLLLLLHGYVSSKFLPRDVATLVDSMDAKWGQTDTPPEKWQRLKTKQQFYLQNGIAKLQLDDGVQVIVEAPAVFNFRTLDQMMLHEGRLNALVSEEGHGFTVHTPTSQIIDLGTEFGIEVSPNETQTFLFQGQARLLAVNNGTPQAESLLTEGHAKAVDANRQINAVSFNDASFVRAMDSAQDFVWRGEPLELSHILIGGSGFGGPLTTQDSKQVQAFIQLDQPYQNESTLERKGAFGPIQVSSLGSHYNSWLDTSGVTWQEASVADGDHPLNDLAMRGVHYRNAIFMHSNLRITFDLMAIRKAASGIQISQFRALVGLTDPLSGATMDTNDKHSLSRSVGFHVLLDGQERFRRKGLTHANDPVTVNIPILPEDHFLTLIVSGVDDELIDGDYCLFADPELILQP